MTRVLRARNKLRRHPTGLLSSAGRTTTRIGVLLVTFAVRARQGLHQLPLEAILLRWTALNCIRVVICYGKLAIIEISVLIIHVARALAQPPVC